MTFLLRLKFGAVCGLAIWSVVIVLFYLVTRPITPLTFTVVRAVQQSVAAPKEQSNKTVQLPRTNELPPKHDDGEPEAAVYVVMAAKTDEMGGLIAAVNSVFTNTKVKVHFYLVCSKDDATHLKTWIVSTHLHRMSYTLRDIGESKIRKVKIDFPDIFPEIQSKVIFLDCDVIVKGDLLQLYNTPISPGDYGAFVTDCPKSGEPGLRLRYSSFINIKHKQYSFTPEPNRCPFNTGVFLANVTHWRAENLTGRLNEWLLRHRKEPITSTQGAANEVEAAMLIELYEKTSPIDSSWNVHHLGSKTERRYSKQHMDGAKLVHWSGNWKPWRHRSAYSDIWDRYFIPDPTGLFRPSRQRNSHN